LGDAVTYGARFAKRVRGVGPISTTVLASSKPMKPRRPIKLVAPSWRSAQYIYDVVVPIRILSKNQTAGGKENGFARAKRRRNERDQTRIILGRQAWEWGFPVLVTIYRIAPRAFDDDNPDCKAPRDEVAAWLGVNDRDKSKVKFVVDQQKGPEYGCRIRIERMAY
jgi:hypothetical protein